MEKPKPATTPSDFRPPRNTMKIPRFAACLVALNLTALPETRAAAVMAYAVEHGGPKASTQIVNIQNGQVWTHGMGNDANVDILFDESRQQAVIIDHARQRYTPITDDSVRKLTSRLEGMSYMLRGLNDQIKQLGPEQKAKWGMLLDGLPVDAIDEAQKAVAGLGLESMGKAQYFTGIRCEWMRLNLAQSAPVEFCLAAVDALSLSAEDRNALQGLVRLTQTLLQRAQGLASRFGVNISQSDLDKLAGIPLAIEDRRGKQRLSMTLTAIGPAKTPLDPPTIPEHYRSEGLKFW